VSLWRVLGFGLVFSFTFSASGFSQARIELSHALALHGQPALSTGFTHFPFVNPNAPIGGHLRLDSTGTFDSLNPFISKGIPAEGISRIYDSLTAASPDEPFSRYGLLAERIERDPNDASWVIYQLRPEARFSDGTPVRATDVVETFRLIQDQGAPAYKAYFADIKRVQALTPLRVRFDFRSNHNRELPLIVGEMSILPKHYWQGRAFDKSSLEIPIGSGPYTVASIDPGRRITYARNPSYWGWKLPVNRGLHNFKSISYRYYRDGSVAFEAFKADQYDIRLENKAKTWATEYNFPAVQSGRVIKLEQQHENPSGMQGFLFNTRRSPLNDIRIREAISLAFDFEWSNRALFYQAYKRTSSYFDNSALAATGLPSQAEQRLLKPFKNQLSSQAFGQAVMPPISQGDGYNRDNLIAAQKLLKQAGWRVQQGQLINAKGEPLRLEMLLVQPEFERITQPFKRNLARLGITLDIRILDAAQYVERLRQFDFDLTVGGFPASSSPGNELWSFWSSTAATTPGSRNLTGLKSAAVDSLIAQVTRAQDRSELVTAVRALDRVLRSQHLVVPHYHTPVYRIAAWNRFGRPERPPRFGDGIDSWWFNSPATEAK
jgi:microcin C transport system substrate-binding protein